jgi:TPR repeat protein
LIPRRDAKAQFNLGVKYTFGKGVLKDYKQAVYWYQKAADQGDAKAQSNLGTMYAFGKGVLKDYKQAVYWYQKAAYTACLSSFNTPLPKAYLTPRLNCVCACP